MKPFYIIESGEVPQATAEVVESAQSRYVAVEHARMSSLSPFLEGFHSFPLDSALRYTPLDIINLLHNIDNHLTDMQDTQEELRHGVPGAIASNSSKERSRVVAVNRQ